MSWSSLESSLVHVVKHVYPTLTTIKGYTNGPEPVSPYCWVEVLYLDPAGTEQVSTLTTSGALQVVRHYVGRCRLTFVGKDTTSNHGGDLAAEFSESLRKPSVLEKLELEKISLLSEGTIKRIPKVRETGWYNTYVVELVIGYQITTSDDNDGITTVVMDGEYVEGADSITTEITIST